MKKERADKLTVQQGLADTVDKAKRIIMSGKLLTEDNQRIDTVGEKLSLETKLKIKGEALKYVSRGGYKLEKALQVFDITITDKIVLDIGSSTGGFTDAALQNGAKYCYALDVGTNQLVWKLRQDSRVIVMEKTNFRYSKKEDFIKGIPEFISIDVSFISLKKILPVLKTIIEPGSSVIALIKPQFEAKKEWIGPKGIITNPDIHEKIVTNIIDFASKEGYQLNGLTFSPITGGQGNIEFLAYLSLVDSSNKELGHENKIKEIVTEAHKHFY